MLRIHNIFVPVSCLDLLINNQISSLGKEDMEGIGN